MVANARLIAWMAMGLLASCACVFAVPVAINNPSFEANVLVVDGFTVNTLTGWTATPVCSSGVGCVGAWHPASQITPLDGSNVAYLSDNSSIGQMTSTAVQANTMYMLSIGVGIRSDNRPGTLWRLELYTGSTRVACLDAAGSTSTECTVSSTGLPAPGNWNTATLMYTTGSSVSGNLGIRIAGLDPTPGSVNQTVFDTVALNASAAPGPGVPEPFSSVLIGSGLMAVALLRLKFRT